MRLCKNSLSNSYITTNVKKPDSIDDAQRKFNDYDRLYKTLAEGLNQLSGDKFNVVGQCLTYQEVFKDYDLEESVRSFYSL